MKRRLALIVIPVACVVCAAAGFLVGWAAFHQPARQVLECDRQREVYGAWPPPEVCIPADDQRGSWHIVQVPDGKRLTLTTP